MGLAALPLPLPMVVASTPQFFCSWGFMLGLVSATQMEKVVMQGHPSARVSNASLEWHVALSNYTPV